MAEFVYNNARNASTGYTLFELNCGYHLCILFDNNTNPCSKSYSANELAKELKNLISIYWQNLLHAQKLPKQAHDKGV